MQKTFWRTSFLLIFCEAWIGMWTWVYMGRENVVTLMKAEEMRTYSLELGCLPGMLRMRTLCVAYWAFGVLKGWGWMTREMAMPPSQSQMLE